MIRFAAGVGVLAQPVFAHHEVVVATSMAPAIYGAVLIGMSFIATWRRRKAKTTPLSFGFFKRFKRD